MTRFSIPYIDQPLTFWEGINEKYGSYIKEVYFPLPHFSIGTGRPLQPDRFLYDFLNSRILPASVLINPVVLPDSLENLLEGIVDTIRLLSEHGNLIGATLTNLNLAKYIRKRFPSLELTASTLMDVFTPGQTLLLNDLFDYVVPSSRIVRNLPALKVLRTSFKGKIRLMINESCLPDCLYRTQHFYEMSDRVISFPESLCRETLEEYPWLALTGSWILPQHLRFFEGTYDEIKLDGRVSLNIPEKYNDVLKSYIYKTSLSPDQIGGGPASVRFPIKISDTFYQTTLECDKNCMTCNFCRDYFNRHHNEYVHETI
jgi:hypothetical protein